MRVMPLRVISPAATDNDCQGCSRRAVLHGLAITAAGALVGCSTSASSSMPDAGPGAAVTMCGANLCLDLNDPLNAPLTAMNGVVTVSAPGDTILVMRTSTTVVQAVSDICTHAMCRVAFNAAARTLNCPCHGSRYSLTGAVLQGPAPRPLTRYNAQLDTTTNIVTITL